MNELQQKVCALVKKCEGLKFNAYLDTANIWTIGIGQARTYPDGRPIKKGDVCTLEQAYEWLNTHLVKEVYPSVDKLKQKYNFNDKVYISLCSFAYNLGASTLQSPSIINALMSNNLDTLATAFRKFVNAGGEYNKGLANRREIEIQIFAA